MTRPSQNRTRQLYHAQADPRPSGVEAFGVFGLAFAGLILLATLTSDLGLLSVIAAQAVMAGVPLVYVAVRGYSFTDALGLALPTPRALLGAALIGATFWYLNAALIAPVAERLFDNDSDVRELSALIAAPGPSVLALLATLAVAPAIGEELLLRGTVARALAARLGRGWAVVISALLFGLLHLPSRLLPATCFGLVLGWVALRSRTTLAAMLVHVLNNGLVLWLAPERGDPTSATVVGWLETWPLATLAVAALGCASGFTLLATCREPRRDRKPLE